jgi:hypothetical protein
MLNGKCFAMSEGDFVGNAFAASRSVISTKFTDPPRDFKTMVATEPKTAFNDN